MGIKHLQEVVKSCDTLYERLCQKWTRNLGAVRLLMRNVVKVKMRIHAALGDLDKIAECRQELRRLGCDSDPAIEKQIEHLLIAHQYPSLIRVCNWVVKAGFFASSFLLKVEKTEQPKEHSAKIPNTPL